MSQNEPDPDDLDEGTSSKLTSVLSSGTSHDRHLSYEKTDKAVGRVLRSITSISLE